MKYILQIFALICFFAAPAFAMTGVEVGQPAPGFSLPDTHGVTQNLSDYRGKIVVLEWMNHECPYVRKHYESGNMQALQKEATAQDVVWLSIVSSAPGEQGHVSAAEANEIIAQTGAVATARLLDPEGATGRLYGAKTTPHMFIVDQGGVLVYAGAIDDSPSSNPKTIHNATNYVQVALADLAAGKPVAQAVTRPYGCSVKYAR